MSAIRSQHGRVFERLMLEQRSTLLESMAMGHKRPMYWKLVGQLQGLDDAIKVSEQADYNINGDEPNAGA